ncbi:MAG: LacI family DNA-binding transcriptional regulator [Verrucomicrobiae bacterium]|nr:LacI family DNA-binding transcriptional regulator [Verrucomicrobiae bacterium]
MKIQRVTLRDVAREAGVANVTVSNILNNSPLPYNAKTREHVQRVARRLGYRPNTIAQSMRNHHTRLVGMLVADVLGSHVSDIISSSEHALAQAGYQVLLCQSHGNLDSHEQLIQTLLQRNVDGLLIGVIHSSAHNRLYRQIHRLGAPLVLFDSALKGFKDRIPVVESDQLRLTEMAVDHLWERGHRQIRFFAPPLHLTAAEEQRRGFLEAMRRRGVSRPEEYIVPSGYSEESGAQAFDALKTAGKPFTALIAFAFCGYGILDRAKALKLKVPGDFALVTIGGGRESRRMGLIDVDQQPRRIGEKMAEILLELVQPKHQGGPASSLATRAGSVEWREKIAPILMVPTEC